MIRVLAFGLLVSCAAQPAYTQEVQYTQTDTGGVIQYHNRVTAGSPVEETYVFGDIIVQHVRRPNALSDTDTITVIGVPDGYVAVPYYLELNEGTYGEIEIVPWTGS